jgi:tetratricopeptide (TPR) repeat protein
MMIIHSHTARSLSKIATGEERKNNFVKAEEYFKRALKIREEQLGPTHSRVGQTLKHMITLYEMQERFKDAIECGSRALTISENIFGSGNPLPPLRALAADLGLFITLLYPSPGLTH